MRPAGSRARARSFRSLMTVLALSLAVLVSGTGLAAAGPVIATVLTIKAPASVAAGKSAKISGTLSTGASKLAAAPVALRWRAVGTSTWKGSAVATTSSKGVWSAKVPVTVNTEFQAQFAGTAATPASTSAVVTTSAVQSIKVTTVSPIRPAIGQVLTVTGTASAALRGRTVSLQRSRFGTWTTVAKSAVSAEGTYTAKIRVADASAYVLRVRSGATKSISRATSVTRTVYVAVTATLGTGKKLAGRRVLTSPNGLYNATMQRDGNLSVKNSTGATLWSSGTAGKGAALTMGVDGNLVLAAKAGELWSTKTAGSAAVLVMQNDGNLVVFNRGKSLWSSTKGTTARVRPAACWSLTFDCISFSSYKPSISYWAMYAGHNCTNYVAYRMISKGVTKSPWGLPGGSAWQWRANAKKVKIKVDTNPTVGSVIQWNRNTNGGGRSGHVAYVERVTDTSILISEDSWSGNSAVRTIRRDSATFASARFIHIKDSGSA
ncbi:MAG: hypothetical protein QOF52_2220 [Propionibacteriaceae bacterium]|nr:hypothetical protein [Propionibacteriaceae bacterium]